MFIGFFCPSKTPAFSKTTYWSAGVLATPSKNLTGSPVMKQKNGRRTINVNIKGKKFTVSWLQLV
jgi:hypothetical protein